MTLRLLGLVTDSHRSSLVLLLDLTYLVFILLILSKIPVLVTPPHCTTARAIVRKICVQFFCIFSLHLGSFHLRPTPGLVFVAASCGFLLWPNIGLKVYGSVILLGIGSSTILVASLSITADLIAKNTECSGFVFGKRIVSEFD